MDEVTSNKEQKKITLTEKFEDTYKQLQIILEKIDKNILIIIEVTEKIFTYINKEKN